MKRILSFTAVFVLCIACLMAGCGKNDPLPQDPPEEFPPDQLNVELPEGLACRPIEGGGGYEVYVADEEKVKALSGTVVLPSYYEGSPVTSIEKNTFKGCKKIEEVILPEGLTLMGSQCFSGSGLVRISIPDTCPSLGSGAFSECAKLESVKLPEGLGYIAYEAFANCTSLKEIALPENLTSIESGAFRGCSSLESITLPSTLLYIYAYAFKGCTSLGPDLIIPESVQIIGSYAFNPSGVRSVILPDTFRDIGTRAFAFTTIYTAADRTRFGNLDNWRTEWCVDSECFYGSTLRYDGKVPYVYSVDGVDFINQYVDAGGDPENLTYLYGEEFYLFPIFSPFREGYEFKGWSKTEGSDEIDFGLTLYDPATSSSIVKQICEYYGQGPFLTSLMSDVRQIKAHQPLYAVWEPIA